MKLSDQHSALQEIEELKKENRALKEAVSKLTLDKLCLEKCVEIGERDFGMELKKKARSTGIEEIRQKIVEKKVPFQNEFCLVNGLELASPGFYKKEEAHRKIKEN